MFIMQSAEQALTGEKTAIITTTRTRRTTTSKHCTITAVAPRSRQGNLINKKFSVIWNSFSLNINFLTMI